MSGFLLLLSAPVLFAGFVRSPLALLLIMILFIVWVSFLMIADSKFRRVRYGPPKDPATAEEAEVQEVVS